VRMPGDGSCLFHAIAFGLKFLGYAEDGHSVRQRVAKFIAAKPDLEIAGTPVRSWVDWDSSMSIGSYVSRLAAGGFWGGAIEMAACARACGVDIAVYEEDWSRGGFQRISDFLTDGQPRGVVFVLYSGRSHYDALQLQSQDGSRQQRYVGSSVSSGSPSHYLLRDRSTSGEQYEEEDDWGQCTVM